MSTAQKTSLALRENAETTHESAERPHEAILRNFDTRARAEAQKKPEGFAENAREIISGIGETTKAVAQEAVRFVKENKGVIITGAAIALAAYGLKKLFFDGEKSEAAETREGFWGWIKKFLGIGAMGAGIGLSANLVGKLLGGDLNAGISWAAGKIKKFGANKVRDALELTGLSKENIDKIMAGTEKASEALAHPLETLKEQAEKLRNTLAEHGISTDWLPSAEKIWDSVKDNKELIAKGATAILGFFVLNKISGGSLIHLLSAKRVALAGALAVFFGSDSEIMQDLYKKMGFDDRDGDGQINRTEIAWQSAEKAGEGAKWLKEKMDNVLLAFGFSERGANVIFYATGYLTIKYGRTLLNNAIPMTAMIALITSVAWVLETEGAEAADGETMLNRALDKAQEIAPEVQEHRKNLVAVFKNPVAAGAEFREKHKGDWVLNIIGSVNFIGDFAAEFGETTVDLLNAISENDTVNQNTKAYIEKVSEGQERFSLVAFFAALGRDGSGAVWAEDGLHFILKGARGYKELLCASVKPFGMAGKALVANPSWEGVAEGAKAYFAGASFFIVMGGIHGLFTGGKWGAVKGGLKGSVAPFYIVKNTIKAPFVAARVLGDLPEWIRLKAENLKIAITPAITKRQKIEKLGMQYEAAYRNKLYWEEGKGTGNQNWTKQGGVQKYVDEMFAIEEEFRKQGFNSREIEKMRDGIINRIENPKLKNVQEMITMADHINDLDKEIEREFAKFLEEIKTLSKSEQIARAKEFEKKWIKPHAELKSQALQDLDASWRTLKNTFSPEEARVFKQKYQALLGFNKAAATTKMIITDIKVQGGKYAIVGLGLSAMLAMKGNEIHNQDPQKEWYSILAELGPDALQLIYELLMPFGLGNFDNMISGEERFTDKKVEGFVDRYAINGLFGAIGFVADGATLLSGGTLLPVALAAKLATKAKKGAQGVRLVQKALPRIAAVIEKVGIKNAFQWTEDFVKSGGKTAEALTKVSGALNVVGLATGGIMIGNVAYAAVYSKPQKEFAVSEDLQEEEENL